MAAMLALFFWMMAAVTVVLFLGRVWWLPELASVHGAEIDRQFVLTLAISGLVFLLAQVGLGYLIWRYRARGEGRAVYWHESPKLEFTWTLATAVLFIGVGVQGNRVWANLVSADQGQGAVTIEITAQQFAWNVRYPGKDGKFGRTDPSRINDSLANYLGVDPNDPAGRDDIVTQNLVAVPVNQPVQLILRTKDVTHSFYVPNLRVKQDAVPGMAIRNHFTATKAGEYEIACAELCGMQHYMMRGRLLVMPRQEFDNWLAQRAAPE